MKSTALALVLAAVSLATVPAFANDRGDDRVHDRSVFAIETALRDRGLNVQSVEEWGQLIRAWVPDGNGGTASVFIDPDTLQPVQTYNG